MNQTLISALEQVKMAKVQVFPRSVKKQINLFEDDISSEISFNGHNTPLSYQHYLEGYYIACKLVIGQEMNLKQSQLEELKRQFDLAKFEVREFRLRYFPKNDTDTLFYRVEFAKSVRLNSLHDDGLKKNS